MPMIESVPEQFWGLFRSKNRFIYMEALRSVNEEYQYNNYFISQEAAQQVIEQCFTAQRLKLEEEENETDLERIQPPAARTLNWLVRAGWLNRLEDYMQGITHIVIPDYAAVFLEAFERLYQEEDDAAEVYIRNVYASVFSYIHDAREDLSLLKGVLQNTKILNKSLQRMLHNMNRFFTELLCADSYGTLLEEHLHGYVEEVVQKKYHILKTSDNFYLYKNDIQKWLKEILEKTARRAQELEPEEPAGEFGEESAKTEGKHEEDIRRLLEKCRRERELAQEISRAFDDIERRIFLMDREHSRYVRTTVMRLNYLINEDRDTKGQIIRFLNSISDRPELQSEALQEAAQAMHFTGMDVMNRERFYRKRKGRAAFQAAEREDEVQPELTREEILRMNQTHNRYSRRQIEEFLDSHSPEGIFVTEQETVRDFETFEKLILAYDYALRRGGRYRVTALEETIDNGQYRYPKLKFERRS